MSKVIRIGKDAKLRLERISDIEGLTLQEAISRAISFYEIALLRRFLSRKNVELTPEQWAKVREIQEWLKRQGKRKFKDLTKKGEN